MVSVVIFSRDDILELLDRWKEPSNLSTRPAIQTKNYRLFIEENAVHSLDLLRDMHNEY